MIAHHCWLSATALIGCAVGIFPDTARSGEGFRPDTKAVYLTDLDRCDPQSALSNRALRGVWRTVPYLTESFPGTMLVATEESKPPDLTYPLQRTGWYEIYIGIYRKPFEEDKQVQVKLTDDPAYTTLRGLPGTKDHRENWIDDIYWKTADLTGRRITFRQTQLPAVQHAWVAYIKLVPLSDEQFEALQRDRTRTDTKRLFAHSDAHLSNITGSKEVILKFLEPLNHTDVTRLYWEAGGGDRMLYFSNVAPTYAVHWDDLGGKENIFFPRKIDHAWDETWRAYRKNDVDPLRVAAEFAHQIGLELHASYRPGGFVYPPPHDELYGQFAREHPELFCVDREGKPVPRISYAFRETRRYVISLFREMAEYPIDGVCILYNRRPPLIAYEAPLVEGFQSQYGEDPRQLDPEDARWLSYRSTALTQFMRELRAELEAVGKKQKRTQRLAISAVVFREEENVLHGMDLPTWIQEGLVDTIIPYSSSVRLNSFVPAWEKPEDVAYFVSLVEGTNCQLAPNLMPRDLTAEEYRRKAHLLYGAGIKNFFFWDGIERVRKASRLGHQQEVSDWIEAGEPAITPTATRLQKLGDWDLKTETPG